METDRTKQDVRKFYDQIGWQKVSEDTYQNAQYEDLRRVSSSYIHKCHMRINRHLKPSGKYLLDAGSGPIQYPQYLSYSKKYTYRVCLDISIVALEEARGRIGAHGLFVVADVARLPFKDDVFEGIVSLHTLHHVPAQDYVPAFWQLRRVLSPNATAVIVNGWSESRLMRLFRYPMLLIERVQRLGTRHPAGAKTAQSSPKTTQEKPKGTFVHKLTAQSLEESLGEEFPFEIIVWRSVSVRFLRALIHPFFFGRFFLWIIYQLEELFPAYFGVNGQYPMIYFKKTSNGWTGR